MSTSALASARRRRATNETPVAPTSNIPPANTINAATRPGQVASPRDQGQGQNQTLTPLQILQIHDIKLKELETLVMDFTDEDALSKFIDDKFDSMLPSKNGTSNNQSQSLSLYEEKLQMFEKHLEQKIELQNNKIDEFKVAIRELINNIKEDNTNIMKYINSNIQNQITSNNNLLNDKLGQNCEKMNNFDNILREFNELKLLVIKSQTMSLEMSNSVNKLYEQCNYNSTKAKAIEEDVALLHSKKHTNSSNIMLQSLLNGSLFNSGELKPFAFNADGLDCGDCGDCNEYEENTDLDEIKKLNIDFNNNELLLSEEQIEDLLNITPANSNISIHEIITNDETTINVEAPVQEAPVQEAPVQEAPQTEEPVPEEPVPTEEHVSSEHVSTEHVPTEHVPTETLSTEPLSTEHVPTEPLPTEPAI
jgi:hypothetical protein